MRSTKTQGRNPTARKLFAEFRARHERGEYISNPEVLLDNLTLLQRTFIIEFLKDLNGVRAVLAAGYDTPPGNANRISTQLLQNEKIQLVIELLQIKRAKKSSVTKDYVLQGVVKLIEACNIPDDDKYNPNAVLRGYELLARHLGMFIDRQEITGRDGEAIRYEKVQEDARDFEGAITRLADKRRTDEPSLRVVGGSES